MSRALVSKAYAKHALSKIRNDPIRAAVSIGHFLQDLTMDFEHGMSFDDALRNQATPYWILREIRNHMALARVPTDLFVDVGCRSGRPLYYFASHFQNLVGYEINPEVGRRAQLKLKKNRKRNAALSRVSITIEDATLHLTSSRPAVLFMFNPFGSDQVAQLCTCLNSSEGKTFIYYVNPLHANTISTHLKFSRMEKIKDHTMFYVS